MSAATRQTNHPSGTVILAPPKEPHLYRYSELSIKTCQSDALTRECHPRSEQSASECETRGSSEESSPIIKPIIPGFSRECKTQNDVPLYCHAPHGVAIAIRNPGILSSRAEALASCRGIPAISLSSYLPRCSCFF